MLVSPKRGPVLGMVLFIFTVILYIFLWETPAYSSSTGTSSFGGSQRAGSSGKAVSYDKTTPPSTGCEDVVIGLQQKIIEVYSKALKGIRYANVWGYLETENKGDAAIWAAQEILLSTMGITSMEACRYLNQTLPEFAPPGQSICDVPKFTKALEVHKPHSAIIMAGGGNFNDYYWDDQPARLEMIERFPDVPIRMFPQSIHLTQRDKIDLTKKRFNGHKDIQITARDQPSFNWINDAFGRGSNVMKTLSPDIAFMWGSRPDFRLNTPKKYDVLILARKDKEISAGESKKIPVGSGMLDLGGTIGKVKYLKQDWKTLATPDINDKGHREKGEKQRAWAKAVQGFEWLGSARFIITDRLHGHIMSTIIGTPHVLLDSKLKKNLNFHETWTKDCDCARIADNFDEALHFARLFFERERKQ